MTALQITLGLGGAALLTLVVLIAWKRHRRRRTSTIVWPLDIYLEERRRRIASLNDRLGQRKRHGRSTSEAPPQTAETLRFASSDGACGPEPRRRRSQAPRRPAPRRRGAPCAP